MPRYAKIVFPYPIPENYFYIIPEKFQDTLQIGSRVLVNLRNSIEEGIIIQIEEDVSIHTNEDQLFNTEISYKNILEPLEEFPIVTQEQIELAKWMKTIYLCEVGEALAKMYPKPVNINLNAIKTAQIEKKIYKENLITLTEEQRKIYEQIQETLDINKPSIHLIQGITGSGKTEIYLHLITDVILNKKKVLFLVPEISLTIQMIQRIKKIVGENLSVLHSRLVQTQRFSEYLKILFNKVDVVLGTRSSVFAPLKDLGLIIIDEEHDTSFQDDSHPRYDARFIAQKKIQELKIPLVLGSATPRVEIRYIIEKDHNIESNQTLFRLYFLKKRVLGKPPKVQIIEKQNLDQPISNTLLNKIEETLKKKRQILILLNRRGYAPYLYCKKCKVNLQCPNCSVSLTLHKSTDLILKCHYCGYEKHTNLLCPVCQSKLIKLGTGTQKIEEFLLSMFPNIKLARLDTDIVLKNKALHETLKQFIAGEIQILTGTQMISKGLDAPNLTLVGVLNAEEGFYLPDFRATERTFSLLLQASGRAGRRDDLGMVYLEVQNKENIYITWAINQDYESFYQHELKQRNIFHYPPFCRLIRFLIRSPKQKQSEVLINEFFYQLEYILQKNKSLFTILGPAPAPIIKISNKYRNHLLIKTNQFEETLKAIQQTVTDFKRKLTNDDYLEIEIDPVDLL